MFEEISSRHRHALMVGNGALSHKKRLYMEGHQNCITGSRVTAIYLMGGFFLLDKVVRLVDGGSVINGAYPI